MPEPQPISLGNISQGIALFKTNKLPVRAARSSMWDLPAWGLGGSSGRSGSIACLGFSSSVVYERFQRWRSMGLFEKLMKRMAQYYARECGGID
jgi:putative transposase